MDKDFKKATNDTDNLPLQDQEVADAVRRELDAKDEGVGPLHDNVKPAEGTIFAPQ